MTFAEMIEEVRERIGERTENFWKTTFIKRHLNDGVRRFHHEEEWPWLWTLKENVAVGAGSHTFQLEDDIDFGRHFNLALTKVGDSSGAIVIPKRVQAGRGLALRSQFYQQDIPQWYALYGSDADDATKIRLFPTPAVAYTLEYIYLREDTDMTADANVPKMPLGYHMGPVAWATAQCFLKENTGVGSNKAQEQFNLYNEIVEQARAELEKFAYDEVLRWGGAPPEFTYDDLDPARRHIIGPVGV